jgi:hypothetical protein
MLMSIAAVVLCRLEGHRRFAREAAPVPCLFPRETGLSPHWAL